MRTFFVHLVMCIQILHDLSQFTQERKSDGKRHDSSSISDRPSGYWHKLSEKARERAPGRRVFGRLGSLCVELGLFKTYFFDSYSWNRAHRSQRG
jgi:hypothetical protein